jgi:tricorn protease
VRFRPLASETDLIYLAWVRKNMDEVTRATQGRVGYIHVPDMGANGIREFIKYWYPQLSKEAMIVDVRGNGGGNISPMLIERLSRRMRGVMYGREQSMAYTFPSQMLHGPMVALINETSGSDGDLFPWQFRNVGLGPLIGKRTWGGVVGITNRGKLLDGGDVFVPEFGTADTKGQWAIEGEGVAPDIEVEQNPIEVIAGRDPQLERGIAEVMKRLQSWPGGVPTRAADPVKLN